MKKQILNLGKALTKADQKQVNGGLAAESGTCCNTITYEDGYQYRVCGISKSEALDNLGDSYDNLGGFGAATVTHWCCSSC
ncbi:hypothetical protein [Tenacibaculum sp. 47A_GOM-205m]|uniref:hypothetical protein n=1 Tax=Tenacibaculum sp. 47A_GOM-205m TaxID=1380384 RepID=UPI00048EDF6E|nr:hypothetical protein [Tenacibaculum sp. 47A_GOM-205m]